MKKRIIIEVSDRFHADVKRRALKEQTTIKSYILSVLIEHIKKETNERNTV